MIRFVHCVKRREGMDSGEFRRYWNSDKFQSLLDRMVLLSGARRLERDLTLMVEANTMLQQERGSGEPFDGIIELWLDNAREMDATLDTDEFKELMEEMEDYQKGFVNFQESRRFFTEYNNNGSY